MNGTLAVPLNGVDDLGKIDIDVSLGNKVTHMARWDQELFTNNGPEFKDIRQGGIGDCKILASALAVIMQPRGPQYILGMMKDVGRNNTQKPTLENPNCVVVRLYDSGKNARYIRVPKKVVINTRTLSSQGAQAAFADGPLWVSVLEQAFTALTKDGTWKPSDPKYSRIEGMSYLPLQTILGPEARNLTIPDLADPATRSAAFSDNADNALGGPAKFFFEQMMDPVKIKDGPTQQLIKKTVFPGQDALAHEFLTWANPLAVRHPANPLPPPPKIPGAVPVADPIHLPPPPPPPVVGPTNVAKFKREITDQPGKIIRYEDIEKFFHDQQLDGTTTGVILKWLETNQVVSGKKFTKLYSNWDDLVFGELQTAYNGKCPVYLSSRSNIGTPEGSGASANEPKVRGLVGDHAFALVSAELDQNNRNRKMVTIRNPWATYGRTYVPDPTDQHLRAAERDSPVSTLPVQEITKRFRRMVIGGMSLA
jgi:hypothetical protein